MDDDFDDLSWSDDDSAPSERDRINDVRDNSIHNSCNQTCKYRMVVVVVRMTMTMMMMIELNFG